MHLVLFTTTAFAAPISVDYARPYELYTGEGTPPVVIVPDRVTASSTLEPSSGRYAPGHATDDDQNTAWCEGQKGPGVGESITLHFDTPVEVDQIHIWGGYFKSEKTLFENARLHGYRVSFNGPHGPDFETRDVQRHRFHQASHTGNIIGGSRFSVPVAPVLASNITIEALSVFAGDRYADLCISEVWVFSTTPAVGAKTISKGNRGGPGPPEVVCFDGSAAPPTAAMMFHALDMLREEQEYADLVMKQLTPRRTDLDQNGVEEWFVETDRCYAPGCFGAVYQTDPHCGENVCYMGSGLEVIIAHKHIKDGLTLACQARGTKL